MGEYIKGKVLDAGSGNNPIHFGDSVIHIDLSDNADIKVDLNKKLPFKNEEFDTVYCSHALEHLESPYLVLKEFKRILKSDGTLIIALPNPHFILSMQLSKEDHINLICETSMQNILEKIGFKIIKKYRNWLFIRNKLFGMICQHLPVFLQTDYWLIARKVRDA